jgi:elongation of very long chain fatty acids protein 7
MASMLTRFYELVDTYGDERTKDKFMMDQPLTILMICAGYVAVVKVIGPKLMENRKPYELNKLMMLYNVGQVVFNTWLFRELLVSGWANEFSFRCAPNNPAKTEKTLRMARACHFFFLSKFVDFIDTFFFVLRKKDSHISVLHVFHHATTPISGMFLKL